MIEIKKAESHEQYDLVVDGVTAAENDVIIYSSTGDTYSVTIYDDVLNQRILSYRFSDLPASIWLLEVFVEPDLVETPEISEAIRIIHGSPSDPVEIHFDFDFLFDKWKSLWSIEEYIKEIFNISVQKETPGLRLNPQDEFTVSEFSFHASVENTENTLEEELSKYVGHIRELHKLTEMSLASKLRNESVVMYFDFPEQVRVSCEQYLLYFVQFLKDLGVEATAELQHDAGQVLFAVTPTDKQEALDKIRAALETYLSLPASKLTGEDQDMSCNGSRATSTI